MRQILALVFMIIITSAYADSTCYPSGNTIRCVDDPKKDSRGISDLIPLMNPDNSYAGQLQRAQQQELEQELKRQQIIELKERTRQIQEETRRKVEFEKRQLQLAEEKRLHEQVEFNNTFPPDMDNEIFGISVFDRPESLKSRGWILTEKKSSRNPLIRLYELRRSDLSGQFVAVFMDHRYVVKKIVECMKKVPIADSLTLLQVVYIPQPMPRRGQLIGKFGSDYTFHKSEAGNSDVLTWKRQNVEVTMDNTGRYGSVFEFNFPEKIKSERMEAFSAVFFLPMMGCTSKVK